MSQPMPKHISAADVTDLGASFGVTPSRVFRQTLLDVVWAETHRVLTPGGRLLILEFGRPQNRMFSAVYRLYVFHILPWIGRLVSGSKEAYRYLPESVWAFYGTEELGELMQAAGFESVAARPFYNGAVVLHSATRATG